MKGPAAQAAMHSGSDMLAGRSSRFAMTTDM